jgi:adenine-specific DNA-methyltransferase
MIKFNEKYDRVDFSDFLINFLPEDYQEKEMDITQLKGCKIISSAREVGYCKSLNLYVLEMGHLKNSDPRITIATDAFKILRSYDIQQALVIFKNNESNNYRFSYLTISFDITEKNKVTKSYSNARRYSFYLGLNAKTKTPEQQLVKKGRINDREDLLSRFSVEVVNKEFYLEVAKFFDKLVSEEEQNLLLPGISQDNINIRKSFAVRLIGRIMFCWFLKQKKSDNGQLVPDELLSSKSVKDNYYHNILEPLFFGVLNTSIDSRDIRNNLFDKVPYLNGGLFNPQSEDYYELDRGTFASKYINTLKVNDSWFSDFFDLLEKYNFTIDENTAFDQELSVDPEMLGKIFENLLAKKINVETGASEQKETGSFYTPRPIVEYMVDQSLVEYLKTKTKIDDKKLSALVSYDIADDIEHPIEDEEKREIITAIESLKMLDPACGSGAYPIGALQKIVYILKQIDPDCKLWLEQKLKGVPDLYRQKIVNYFNDNPADYIRKLDVIKNSIFGVDIQPIAVDVSRLRCFLTLVVESEIDDTKPNRGIEPLPNLDFKFVCANTLVGLPKSHSSNLFEDHSGITGLSQIMSEYFSCNSQRKNEIKLKFINLQKEILEKNISAFGKNTGELTLKLTMWNPFGNISNSWFDSEWMFGIEERFDIVIGNPPYGFRNVLSKEEKEYFRKIEKIEFSSGDSAELFCKKSFDNLVKENGVLSFIIPKKSLYGDAWDGFRRNYWMKYTLNFLLDSSKAFDEVLLEASAFSMSKKTFDAVVKCSHLTESGVVEFAQGKKSDFFLENNTAQIYKLSIPLVFWNKIQNSKIKDKLVEGRLGLAIGTDFYSDEETEYKLLKGIDISKWNIKSNRWLKNTHKLKWSSAEVFLKPKVIAQRLVAHIENPTPHIKITACFDDEGIIITNTLMSFELDKNINQKFWLAYLNSSFISWYVYNFIYARAIRSMDFYNFYIQQIPIPKTVLIAGVQEEIIKLVDDILMLRKDDAKTEIKDIERQIDQLVYKLYDLTPEEIEIVENSSKK